MKLSTTMLEVVGRMRAAGGRIERWQGGFWTTPGQPFHMSSSNHTGSYKVPDWYTTAHTIKALEKRGLVAPDTEQPSGFGTTFVVGYRLVS